MWSKAGLGEGSKEEGPDGTPPLKLGRGTEPSRLLTGCMTQASLSLVSLSYDMGGKTASELDDVLGPSELTTLGDTCSLLHEPMCKFEGQLAEAAGDPVGTAVLTNDKGADQWLESGPSALLALCIRPVLATPGPFPGLGGVDQSPPLLIPALTRGPQLLWCPSQVCSPLGAEEETRMRPRHSGGRTPTLL